MRISSSAISMAATRSYTMEAKEEQYNITRYHEGGSLVSEGVTKTTAEISQFEVEGGIAVFTSSAGGVTREDQNQISHKQSERRPLDDRPQNVGWGGTRMVSAPRSPYWLSGCTRPLYEDPESTFLQKMLELLEKFTGKKYTSGGPFQASKQSTLNGGSYQFSVSQATMRYQETMAMFNRAAALSTGGAVARPQGQAAAVNGHWTRQTVQSGFVAGEEHTAFVSKGTAVTADGRTIDFNISMEMSRSFEAAYMSVGKEEVFTDPLVINLDDSPAELSDVSFYFDLNCDGEAEELSALDGGSGFLALDKNGDGEINDGSELFGAKTGDGFRELAQYDQDGNGWIDEGDEVFSKLSVWVKCGTSGAKQISLAEADVGAIFLGSQNTRYSLTDASGETGAMIRKTGVYLKESGGAGTVQHIDFKA